MKDWVKEEVSPMVVAVIAVVAIISVACLALYGLDKWTKKSPVTAEIIHQQVVEAQDRLNKAVGAQVGGLKVVELGNCQYWVGSGVVTHAGNCTNHGAFVRSVPVPEGDFWYGFFRDKAGYDEYQAKAKAWFAEYWQTKALKERAK